VNAKKENNYDASRITVLKGLDPVRKRPGMYIGDLSEAYRRMILEVVDNSVDEYMAGHATDIKIVINSEYCSVQDNGRGIPVDSHSSGMSGIEVVMTTLHAGGKFDSENYAYSGGLHGVGVSVTNALSDWLEVEVYKNNQIYFMRFEKGIPTTPLINKGHTDQPSGTKVTFRPDFSIIEEKELNVSLLTNFLKKISLLNEGLKITLDNHGKEEGPYPSSLIEFYRGKFLHEPIFFNSNTVRICFGWANKRESVSCFTNNIEQSEGGNHLSGFRFAVTRVISAYLNSHVKKQILLESEDIHNGIGGMLSIRLQEPKFSSQTKNKLVSTEARSLVEQFVSEKLRAWLEENPKEAQIIVKKILNTMEERLLVEKARESMKKLTNTAHHILPGKLIDCRSDRMEECELFIVEGNSAGGSAGQARDAETQAILPTKGKIINVFRQPDYKSMANEEIISIIATIGTGIGEQFDISKLRYNKIVILTDADKDGNHIFTLLLTCFVKFFPELVRRGHIYRAFAPLYKVQSGKVAKYINSEEELDNFLVERFLQKNSITIQETQVDVQKLIEIREYCRTITKRIPNKEGEYKRIFAACSMHGTANLISLQKILEEILGAQVNLNAKLEINVLSLFEKQVYNIVLDQAIESKYFPLRINEKVFYEPVTFLEFIDDNLYQNIDIQRYKGLGEMNADQLEETTLNPQKRNMICLQPKDDNEFNDLLKRLAEVMGNEAPRRDLVLTELGLENYSSRDMEYDI
jgi:DNA gyrase subunit B